MSNRYSKLKRVIKIVRILSQGISVLFHPLLLPTYIFILVGFFSPLAIAPLNTLEGIRFLIGLIFLSTFFLPFLLVALYIMIQNTKWTMKSFVMENSKERVFPFLVIGVFYSILIYFIRYTPQLNELILVVLACMTAAILVLALISNFWKISAHAVGISGMVVILAVINNKTPSSDLFYPLVVLIFLWGCLLSARLYLNAHTPLQILAGTILGVLVGATSYLFI